MRSILSVIDGTYSLMSTETFHVRVFDKKKYKCRKKMSKLALFCFKLDLSQIGKLYRFKVKDYRLKVHDT